MKHNNFFANAASKALALAATVMMMSAAFTACSSSNDDPTTEPKANTVTLDGEEKPILKAEYEDKLNGNYALYLYLSADGKERVNIQLNKDLHMTGHAFNLTKREEEHSGKWYWSVEYYKPDDTKLIDTYGRPGYSIPVFKTGTLTISGSPESTINIKLENGRVEGTDDKEYTLVLSYSGKMTKSGGGTTPTMEYVDLGLSVKWAKCNLGASKPSDYGDYFAWGETEPNKTEYTWATYKWGTEDNITKYNATDGKIVLDSEDDAATANLGSPWRMPTWDEIKELLNNCTWTWTTQDGVNGCEVKGPNGNSIFLPAAGERTGSELDGAGSWGYYRSSSLSAAGSDCALGLYFNSGIDFWTNYYRYEGLPVRPVRP